jgi:ABC-type protease/lipase transport system fused ATPase/permease subunit
MQKTLKNTLIVVLLITGLTACSSTQEKQALAQAHIDQENEKKQDQQKQADLIDKVALLESHVEDWKTAEPNVDRLIPLKMN